MGDTHHRASEVIICLDDPLEEAPLQFQAVMDVLTLWSKPRASLQEIEPLLGPRYSWRRLAQLLSHPYWARVWIIQESGLPKHMRILAEGKLVTWEEFTALWSSIALGPGDRKLRKMLLLAGFSVPELDKLSLNTREMNDVIQLRTSYQLKRTENPPDQSPAVQSPASKLHRLLYGSRRFLCQNSRDKVFGLLGLLGTTMSFGKLLPMISSQTTTYQRKSCTPELLTGSVPQGYMHLS
jgi:hypothetical protein